MKIRILIIQLLMLAGFHCYAQELLGRVFDSKKEPAVNAAVNIKQGGVSKGSVVTDYDGNFSFKPLEPGLYDVTATYLGHATQTITGVIVSPNEQTPITISLKATSSSSLKEVVVRYKKPLTNPYQQSTILTGREIREKPTRQTDDIVSLAPGIYQQKRGGSLNADGARSGGNLYIIDGVQVQGNTAGYNAPSQVQLQANTAEYKKTIESDFKKVLTDPLSTMSVDVDRASYTNIRRFINNGDLPPVDAVRIEEMINYFDYEYPKPTGDDPIAIQTELTTCPWNSKHNLLRIGIKAMEPDIKDLPPTNVVFLVDVSGSMNEPNRLPLVKASLRLLVEQLRKEDKVSMVAYAGNAGLVLPATSGNRKEEIMAAIDRLEAGGSTAGGAGIELAYKIAEENYFKGGNNRVILATDGDFNVGVSNENDLETLIVKKRESGIFLTCLGVGDDNYKDAKMLVLADKGNGNYDYIDNIQEAEKMLVKEFNGTMFTVAKDVKSQIEFNPAAVQSYRLVGYEKRLLNNEDFKDDKKDAGDMGAGHTVTILYELVPAGSDEAVDKLKYQKNDSAQKDYSGEMATIKLRYKAPDGAKSKQIEHVIANEVIAFDNTDNNTRFATAVAMFGMVLRSSEFKGSCNYDDVIKLANASKDKDPDGYKAEMVRLVKAAKVNAQRTSKR